MKKIIATIVIVTIAFLYAPFSLGVTVKISSPAIKIAKYNNARLFGADIDRTLNQGFCNVLTNLLVDNVMLTNIINNKINLIGSPYTVNPNTGTSGTQAAPSTVTPKTTSPNRTITTAPSASAPKTGAGTTGTSLTSYASQVVGLVNKERAAQGLAALKVNSAVTAAAQKRARETATKFSHTRPNGTSAFTALSEANATYRGAGENIAMGQTTPAQVMNGWMNSPGHRANILNSKFTNIGVGCYKDAAGQYYWAQLFTY